MKMHEAIAEVVKEFPSPDWSLYTEPFISWIIYSDGRVEPHLSHCCFNIIAEKQSSVGCVEKRFTGTGNTWQEAVKKLIAERDAEKEKAETLKTIGEIDS
jgi:hypothetical protein